MMLLENRKAIREARVRKTAEIFTPPKIVKAMLDLLPKEVWDKNKNKTFLDPACGDGEILIWILLRKIENGCIPFEALKSIYGVDIMPDNVEETRIRLLKIVSFSVCPVRLTDRCHKRLTAEYIKVVYKNIACADALKYDYEFNEEINEVDLNGFLEHIYENFDKVEVPFNPPQIKISHKEK